jgi:osmotically-inducible protein OsmY
MKIVFALMVGLLVGAAVVWFYATSQGRATVKTTGDQIENTTKSARDEVQEKMKEWNLTPDKIKEDLARTGQVVRRRASEAGQAIADATVDARTTATIKGKLLASRDLSAMSISVNTTDGIVTLSGSVNSPEDISKAMLLAMETDGVREVISVLQVRQAAKKS